MKEVSRSVSSGLVGLHIGAFQSKLFTILGEAILPGIAKLQNVKASENNNNNNGIINTHKHAHI